MTKIDLNLTDQVHNIVFTENLGATIAHLSAQGVFTMDVAAVRQMAKDNPLVPGEAFDLWKCNVHMMLAAYDKGVEDSK